MNGTLARGGLDKPWCGDVWCKRPHARGSVAWIPLSTSWPPRRLHIQLPSQVLEGCIPGINIEQASKDGLQTGTQEHEVQLMAISIWIDNQFFQDTLSLNLRGFVTVTVPLAAVVETSDMTRQVPDPSESQGYRFGRLRKMDTKKSSRSRSVQSKKDVKHSCNNSRAGANHLARLHL